MFRLPKHGNTFSNYYCIVEIKLKKSQTNNDSCLIRSKHNRKLKKQTVGK